LPGGFVRIDEGLEQAALRELREETGVDNLYLEQLASYGAPQRDPRERVITVAHFAIVNLFDHPVKAASDAREAAWFPVDDLPPLAFDHQSIFDDALDRLQNKLRYQPLAFEFLPEKFTLPQLQRLYEIILCTDLDKRNFRKKILATGLIHALEEYEMDVSHRAARYYRFDRERWADGRDDGFEFRV
jgi:8-oxo-dGTP diphosphatase